MDQARSKYSIEGQQGGGNLEGDISTLEKVQRRASKIPNLKDLPYEERLKIWGITS